MKKVLAIDMGATSGKGIVGYVQDDKIILNEVMRFYHNIKEINGRLFWDWEKIICEIIRLIKKLDSHDFVSIGIDTWGVDFGILDGEGNLIEFPLSYRDPMNENTFKELLKRFSKEEIYMLTGNQVMEINTLFQIESIKGNNYDLFKQIDKIVLMPDLINYYLTGNIFAEKTMASTTQLFDMVNKKWNYDLIEKLKYPKELFPEIIDNCRTIGNTKNSLIDELKDKDIDVISVASHDTASAVSITKAFFNDETMFLSSGTWSLLGVCTDEPIINKFAFENDLTNECGFSDKNLFLKNITGLWLIERVIKELEHRKKYTYEEISRLVMDSPHFSCTFDIDQVPTSLGGSIVNFIMDYAEKTNQSIPDNDGIIFRSIYESLVFKYYETVLSIEECLSREFKEIQVISGGSKSNIMCQMLADITNKIILAGPSEATALGNIVIQLIKDKQILNMEEAFNMIKNSFENKTYYPKNHNKWQRAYQKYLRLIERKE